MSSSAHELSAARQRIAAAYAPAALHSAGVQLIEVLTGHFGRVESRDAKVLNWNKPQAQVQHARKQMDDGGVQLRLTPSKSLKCDENFDQLAKRFGDLTRDSLSRGQNLHHPHYVGHQVPAPVPLAGLFDLIGTITNQCMAIYEMGPWATAVEHAVIEAVGEKLGFPAGMFAGLITSGGSVANLTGLLTARNITLKDAWSIGMAGRSPPPVLVAQADAHYSVTRSAGILGLGTNQIVLAPLDDRRRMDPNQLDDTLIGLRKKGVSIIAVSAAACATPIGAFDPLAEIADICQRHEVWLHVDAAHGGALAFSAKHKHLLAGIEQADSVVCDAHKMMFMPALCAMLFYKNLDHRTAAFHQDAPYLFDPTAPELRDYDSGIVNLECTKRAAAFGLWGTWSLLGPQIFADMVDVTIDLAQRFHAMLVAADDFEPLHEPQCNIVAFRHMPARLRSAPAEKIDEYQLRLRRTVIESGEFYLVQSRIAGRHVLRTTMMNPLTTEDDLAALLACLRTTGEKLLHV
jgi:L-2,4-diaminobutyrate decarboxylase